MRISIFALLVAVSPVLATEPTSHWAFVPPKRPPVPGGGHPIDTFLSVARDRHGVNPRPEADKRTLLRRAYLDLVGVPPTPAEVDTFLRDVSPGAFATVVERLLASPMYGERWGRHWMDVWRYSDWDGFGAEVRNSQPHIWHWRDWIVESLNADKGYDRMVMEMLAGDELAPDDADTLRATGFLARNWFMFNRNVWLDNTVEHTAKAFLGLTMNCARCHDHKYDPVAQREYFQFRAFFEPHDVRMDRVPGQPDVKKDGIPRVYDAKLDTPTYLFHRGDEAKPDKEHPLPAGLPAFLVAKLAVTQVSLSMTARWPEKRDFIIREMLAQSLQAVDKAREERALLPRMVAAIPTGTYPLTAAVRAMQFAEAQAIVDLNLQLANAQHFALETVLSAERLEDAGQKDTPEWQRVARETVSHQRSVALFAAKRDVLFATQHRRASGVKAQIDAAEKKLAAAKEAVVKADAAQKTPLTTAYTPRLTTNYPASSSGRRLALAKWIVSRDNPLAARVAVNHIWMRHFGRPLVTTVFDFGRNGQPPSHPALLDWLASELVARGWSMKQLHRLILTSAAYRQQSTPDADALARDSDNRWLWRFAPRRLEGEAVRDSVLRVAGNLDTRIGGADIDQKLGLTVPRRSLYFRHSIEKYVEMLKVFDSANVLECYRRDESIVPQQALALANNPLVLAQARLLARKLNAAGANSTFVAAAFERVLGRPPRPDESAACVSFLNEQAARLAERGKLSAFGAGPSSPVPPSVDPALRAREDLIHVLFNHHEFVTIR